jgi:23S rRNA G2445 N2-methylase RlmL
MQYLSTFPSGFDEIAEAALTSRLVKTTVTRRLDGALEYETNAQPKIISELRFFQNSFSVLKTFSDLGNKPIEKMMRHFLNHGLESRLRNSPAFRNASSFRLMTTKNNQPTGAPPDMRTAIESRIRKATRLHESRSGADVEVWFSSRKDSTGYVMVRFTKRRASEKSLHAGQLRPETAHLLILCSEPSHQDVFLDPFCGYGGILLERLQSHRASLVHGVDSDAAKIRRLQDLASRLPAPARLEVDDARRLAGAPDGSVTRIVTDPPWGEFGGTRNLDGLYKGFLRQFDRVLAADGIAVLLTGRNCPLAGLLESSGVSLRIRQDHNVLISGKKATVSVVGR